MTFTDARFRTAAPTRDNRFIFVNERIFVVWSWRCSSLLMLLFKNIWKISFAVQSVWEFGSDVIDLWVYVVLLSLLYIEAWIVLLINSFKVFILNRLTLMNKHYILAILRNILMNLSINFCILLPWLLSVHYLTLYENILSIGSIESEALFQLSIIVRL